LNEEVKASGQLLNNNSKGIIELINDFDPIDENQEQIIIDNCERNLKRGRLLLLIVGDGIRESVEDMVTYLSSSPQLQFTLGLVELQVFKNPNSEGLIIIPNLITRTREIIRAVIKIENSSTNSNITIETDFEEEGPKTQYTRTTITEDDFFEQLKQNVDLENVVFARLILNEAKEKGYYIDWNQGSFAVKYADPKGSGIKVTLFVTDRKGLFYIGYNSKQLSRLGFSNEISEEFTRRTASLIPGLNPHPTHLGFGNKYSNLNEIKPVYAEFMKEVETLVSKIEQLSIESD
jgi:hypothetical protein